MPAYSAASAARCSTDREREPTASGAAAPTEAATSTRLAVVEDDRGVQHQHQLRGRLLAAFGGQLQDDGELF
ncbi:hypothetical protein [Streptomyces mexicanus]|uniref:hypothetical protein n=1 Tax=Streptomyces mexicanus TaxID=178566 RepID=UPI00369DD074